MSERATIRIPRWIQLVGLPVLLLVGWALAGALGHAIFLFLTASVIAFLLNPLVRSLQGLRIRRGFAVTVVFLSFAAAMVVVIVALVTVVVEQTRSAADRVDTYLTEEPGRSGDSAFDRDVADVESWLHDHGIDVQLRDQVDTWIADVNVSDLTQQAISVAGGAAFGVVQLLFSIILIVVIAVYMLLDMPKLESGIDRRFPPGDRLPLTLRIEKALAGYVRGQLILSTVIGLSAGIGMWILGRTGLVPGADKYALLFGVWTAVIEVIPYIGPWLSAVPPAIYALIVDPVSVLWVLALFVFIYQVEGHIVVPNVMASALRLHPLLVIFGLLAGGELYGIAGVLLALPTMAAARAIWEFFSERLQFDSWDDGGAPPLDLELEVPSDVPLPR